MYHEPDSVKQSERAAGSRGTISKTAIERSGARRRIQRGAFSFTRARTKRLLLARRLREKLDNLWSRWANCSPPRKRSRARRDAGAARIRGKPPPDLDAAA